MATQFTTQTREFKSCLPEKELITLISSLQIKFVGTLPSWSSSNTSTSPAFLFTFALLHSVSDFWTFWHIQPCFLFNVELS